MGVATFYLGQEAQQNGYNPEIILAGRRMNDSMGPYVADQLIKEMILKGQVILGAKVLVLGFTFKENCPDVRNTKVIDVVNRLKEYGTAVTVYDPWANPVEVLHEYGLEITNVLPTDKVDGVMLVVAHDLFKKINEQDLIDAEGVYYDLKSLKR